MCRPPAHWPSHRLNPVYSSPCSRWLRCRLYQYPRAVNGPSVSMPSKRDEAPGWPSRVAG
ncbi:hypothetical protein [Lysobacter gummosus]|uniref:hypothetical protein n=1 Tax=Lysobacter gummosus TaxID=262324 RepID=UPI0036379B37